MEEMNLSKIFKQVQDSIDKEEMDLEGQVWYIVTSPGNWNGPWLYSTATYLIASNPDFYMTKTPS